MDIILFHVFWCMGSFGLVFQCSQGTIPVAELLGQEAVPFLVFWGTSILFSIVASPVCIPTNSVLGFPFLRILSNIGLWICLWWPLWLAYRCFKFLIFYLKQASSASPELAGEHVIQQRVRSGSCFFSVLCYDATVTSQTNVVDFKLLCISNIYSQSPMLLLLPHQDSLWFFLF